METIERRLRKADGLKIAVAAALVPALALAARGPVPVSPGGPGGGRTAQACPTFSWAGAPGSGAYELVVYRVGEGPEEPREVLRQSLPPATNSWTPSLERCLERGGRYAWSVRSVGGGAGVWSSPSLFRVAAAPTEAELAWALEIVRSHLAGSVEAALPARAASELRDEPPAPGSGGTDHGGSHPAPEHGGSRFGEVAIGNGFVHVDGDDVVTTATDSDTLAGLLCGSGQVPKRHQVTGDWFCAPDNMDGLVCPSGQIMRRIGFNWGCDLDRWSGYEVVQGPDVTCSPFSSCFGSAQCPAGKVVIAGGASNDSTEGIRMVSSFPVQLTATWHITQRNTTVANRTLTPWAVCAYGSGGF